MPTNKELEKEVNALRETIEEIDSEEDSDTDDEIIWLCPDCDSEVDEYDTHCGECEYEFGD